MTQKSDSLSLIFREILWNPGLVYGLKNYLKLALDTLLSSINNFEKFFKKQFLSHFLALEISKGRISFILPFFALYGCQNLPKWPKIIVDRYCIV